MRKIPLLAGRSRSTALGEGCHVDRSSSLIMLRIGPSVNDLAVEPQGGAVVNCDPANGVTACTAHGVWWLDPGRRHPGVYIHKPLVVKLVGGDIITADGPGPGPYDASLVVRMVKKK